MQTRGLLAAVALLALLAGGIWWSNKAKEADEKKPPKDAGVKLTNVPDSDLKQVELQRQDGETTTLVRNPSGAWAIKTPAEYAADKDTTSSFISAAASMTSDQVVEEKASDLAPFGLVKPTFTLTLLKKDGKSVKVLLGDDVPTGSGTYARLDGDPRVFTIASYAKSNLDKKAADLRDKRLLTFDSEKLARIELSAHKSVTEFGRNNTNEWTILKPQPLRADNWAVEELLRRLKDAKLDPNSSDEDQKKAAAAFAGSPVIATARVTDNGGTQTLEIRKTKDNKFYAKSSAVAGVHTVVNDIGEGLDKATDDFRAKKLFDFGFSDPNKIDYKDASRTFSLARSADSKWTIGGKLMDSVAVQSLIDKLRDLACTKFGDKGFTTPTIELTVVSNEGKRTEKVQIAQDGQEWWARREGEAALYALDAKVADDLRKAAGDVKEPPPPGAASKKK